MKQKYLVLVLLGLVMVSGATSFKSYQATELLVEEDMSQALASALAEQQSDVISADTMEDLTLEKGYFDSRAAFFQEVFSVMSDQRTASILWMLTLLWAGFCFYHHRRQMPLLAGMCEYGGLNYAESEGRFYDAEGRQIKLTPMQQQLMEMFFRSSSHSLTKTEICDALWPKKPDASETLYTLIRRIKPIIEAHSDLRIEVDRGKAYDLRIK